MIRKPIGERRSMPDRVCHVCLQGSYVTRLETDAVSGPGTLRHLGLMDPGDAAWHVEACSHCGHVQAFRRDWRETRH
jgi:hypothetical protein